MLANQTRHSSITCRRERIGRLRGFVLFAFAAFVTLIASEPAQARPVLRPPDLFPLPSYLANWSVANLGGNARELRFSNANANGGMGPLHIYGGTIHPPAPNGSQTRDVMQRIFDTTGGFTDRLIGVFEHHAAHTHVHVAGWSAYRLRYRNAANIVGPILAETIYTSFCIVDTARFNPSLPGSPVSGQFTTCGTTQGVSVGWNDAYAPGFPGQAVNLAGISSGLYWLEHETDPLHAIEESNETNNVARIAITLSGLPYAGLRVHAALPIGVVEGPVSFVDLTFNHSIDPDTFAPSDVSFAGPSGPISVSSITQVDDITYRVNFRRQSSGGTYTMTIGPSILGFDGTPMDQNSNGTAGEPGDAFVHAFTITEPCIGNVAGGDQAVNVTDLLAVISSWGACAEPCPPHCAADTNHDCAVNVTDLLAVIGHWGPCP